MPLAPVEAQFIKFHEDPRAGQGTLSLNAVFGREMYWEEPLCNGSQPWQHMKFLGVR